MRALLVDPCQVTPAAYRRFLRRAQVEGLMADHLVRGEPYLAPNALVLSARDRACLERLTSAFTSILDVAGRRLVSDVPALIGMGFPWAAAELLATEVPRRPLVARFDLVQDGRGAWRILECNADTPSGVREAVVCEGLVHEMLPEARGLRRTSADLSALLAHAFCRALTDLPEGAVLGLVTTAGELEDMAQMAFTADLLRPALARQGIDVVLGDVGNLGTSRAGLTMLGRRVHALYRYVAFESIFGTAPFAAIEDAVARGRLRLLNGLYGLLLQNKALLAWVWAHRTDADTFDAEERAAILAHLPPTYLIDSLPYGRDRRELVAKQVFGREGEEVFFGEDTSPEVWADLIRRRTYVAQERVTVAPIEAVVMTSAGPRRDIGTATIGCYAVDGRFGGCYSRFGGKIITSRSKWLATLEAADDDADDDGEGTPVRRPRREARP
ncbi:MAG: glutathionylspermidine synthase family protein [Chloroflexi bacterium]|nr:glutathionylspermidine synthase family protein [Chloroflexota bacterium]